MEEEEEAKNALLTPRLKELLLSFRFRCYNYFRVAGCSKVNEAFI